MKEKIYTIPVNEAFDKAEGCPFCALYQTLEDTEIGLITGASMMEPDIRIKTNELGFCPKHFDKMFAFGAKLPVALTLQTHLQKLQTEIQPGGVFAKNDAAKPIRRIKKLVSDCYVCDRINHNFNMMLANACLLFEDEAVFREKFKNCRFFCIPHYGALLEKSKAVNSKNRHAELVKTAGEIVDLYLKELYGDITLFCKKFDYNQRDLPWGNAKDSIERAIDFLSSRR